MFAIVLLATRTDEARIESAWSSVERALHATATGWLGASCAAHGNGDVMAILAFESREAGRITMGDLADSSAWRPLTDASDSVVFHECTEVRAIALHDTSPTDYVKAQWGVASDIQQVLARFERSMHGDAGAVSGVMCWSENLFAASAIQGHRIADAFVSAPPLVAQRPGESILTGGAGPVIAAPLSVLRLGGTS